LPCSPFPPLSSPGHFLPVTLRQRLAGLLLLLTIPVAGLVLYKFVGNPDAINPPPVAGGQQHSIDEMVTQLQQRLREQPDDVEGWLLLGRTLKSMSRLADAEAALQKAKQLKPNQPLIMVELAETHLMLSTSHEFTPDIQQLLITALKIDPMQQKGLWLMGMAARNDGDDARAISLWQKLLDQIDPASDVAGTVKEQIDQARERSGQPALSVPAKDIAVAVDIAADFKADIPRQAVLFVFIRPVGGSGMPLGVKRIAAPQFPLNLHIGNADLLRPGSKLEDFEQLTISARISMQGVANAASGDLQSQTLTFSIKAGEEIALTIDRRVP